MARTFRIGIVSDIHYASAAEQARGDDYELRALSNPLLRTCLRAYRHFIWLRHPLRQNALLNASLDRLESADCLVANGDYSCDTGFVGVSDDAAFSSALACLTLMRQKFPNRIHATIGDHELGKFTFAGRQGGMRLASWNRTVNELDLKPFWQFKHGRYTLMGVTSSLIALPSLSAEILPSEAAAWEALRAEHLEAIRRAFTALPENQRVILFCHDPTALPWLWQADAVQRRIRQIEWTVIGHLHTPLIFWKSRLLAGMPHLRCFGHSISKMSRALNQARLWKAFRVQLCPSLAGSELLKDGGFLTLEIDSEARIAARLQRHRLPRSPATA
jgi:hypothetical protein